MKEADVYLKAAENLEEAKILEKNPHTATDLNRLSNAGLKLLAKNVHPLTARDLHKLSDADEAHLPALAEKLRIGFLPLTSMIIKREKRLRDLIQIKVAADLKLPRDIDAKTSFEIS